MVVHHGSVGITRTVNEQCARRVRLRSSAAYHPASTATTGQESTVTLVMMIHTAAQCSKKIQPSPQGTASTLVVRLSNPMRSYFSSCHGLHALGCHETVLCCGCKNIKRLVLYHSTSTYVRHLNEIPAPGWLLESRLQIPENRSEIVTLGFFSLRSGQIRGA